MAFVNGASLPLTPRTFRQRLVQSRTFRNSRSGTYPIASSAQTEPVKTKVKLSRRAADLLGYIRGHKSVFQAGEGFKSTQAALCRKNDTGHFFIPKQELECNAEALPGKAVAEMILEKNAEIIEQAKEEAVKSGPSLADSKEIIDIVEHDLSYLLRVISYGIACGSTNFIHANNMGIMKVLHKEIGVQGAPMIAGLKSMKGSVESGVNGATEKEITAACFDKVIEFMN